MNTSRIQLCTEKAVEMLVGAFWMHLRVSADFTIVPTVFYIVFVVKHGPQWPQACKTWFEIRI